MQHLHINMSAINSDIIIAPPLDSISMIYTLLTRHMVLRLKEGINVMFIVSSLISHVIVSPMKYAKLNAIMLLVAYTNDSIKILTINFVNPAIFRRMLK